MDENQALQTIAATLKSVAETLKETRAEMDGMRSAVIGVLASLSADPQQQERLALAIAHAGHVMGEMGISTSMSDEMLHERERALRQLMTPQLAQRVQQIRDSLQ